MNKEEKEAIKSLKEFIYENGWMQVGKGKTILNLIDKQNKMIDEMAEELSNIKQFNAEGIKQYFKKKVSEQMITEEQILSHLIVVNLPNTKPTCREKLFAKYIEQLQNKVEELKWINEEQMIINRELKKGE